MPSTATLPPAIVTVPRLVLRHRGFDLEVEHARDGSDGYGFAISHRGLTLHASTAEYRTPQSAERSGRLFIDDALNGFDYATRVLDT
ncbi:MAG: hypothetical protein AAF791_05235 [Bacteroidota bacterium]